MGWLTPLSSLHKVTSADIEAISDEIGGWFANKTSDQTVTSSATLVNDTELVVPVVANAKYILTGMIIYRAAATPQIRTTWAVPAGATMLWNPGALSSSVTATPDGSINRAVYDLSVVPALGCSGAAQSVVAHATGRVVTTATAGNLQFQWAQATSNATGTVVKSGSWIQLVRVG